MATVDAVLSECTFSGESCPRGLLLSQGLCSMPEAVVPAVVFTILKPDWWILANEPARLGAGRGCASRCIECRKNVRFPRRWLVGPVPPRSNTTFSVSWGPTHGIRTRAVRRVGCFANV